MPILKNRPPKYQRSGKYAVVYAHGKRIYLGDYGSPESHVAYSRFVPEYAYVAENFLDVFHKLGARELPISTEMANCSRTL